MSREPTIRPRRAHRQDANHAAIKAYLEKAGCAVIDLSPLGKGIPDLAVFIASVGVLVEIKDGSKPPSARRLSPDEEKFRMNWTGGWKLVENEAQAQEVVELLKKWHGAITQAVSGGITAAAGAVFPPFGGDPATQKQEVTIDP